MWMLTVTERMRLASIKALRGAFTGVGQLLLAADRLRTEAESELERADSNRVQDPLGGWENGGRPDIASQPARRRPDQGARSDRRGRAGGDAAAQWRPEASSSATTTRKPTASRKPTARHGAAGVAPKRPPWPLAATGNVRLLTSEELAEAAEAIKSAEPTTEPDQPSPTPVPGYSDLSLASLRARLRYLSTDQLRELVDYEKSHANRAEVVTLFERRIAKLGTMEPGADDTRPAR